MDIIRINLILSYYSHFSLTLTFFNAEFELDVADQESGPQTAGDEPIIQASLDSRTPQEYLSAIQHAKPTEEADTAPVLVSDAELSALPQLIIRAGESGGVLTQTEFQITKFCAEYKLKKRTHAQER